MPVGLDSQVKAPCHREYGAAEFCVEEACRIGPVSTASPPPLPIAGGSDPSSFTPPLSSRVRDNFSSFAPLAFVGLTVLAIGVVSC